MQASTFLAIFVFFLSAETLWQLYLSWRQQRYVWKHRQQVPAQFSDKISLAEHQKAASYTRDKQVFARLQLLVGALLTVVWTLLGGLTWLQNFSESYFSASTTPFAHALLIVVLFSFICTIVETPLNLYSTFVIEARHGFNRTSWKTYLSDGIKNLCISCLIGIPILWILLWIMNNFLESLWWLYAATFIIAFQLIMLVVYPNFIAPLFNKFEPLQDEQLKQQINELAERCGFAANDIKVMDGSKRSAHGNAYFTGFGKSKKIVFFDTLLDKLSTSQVLAVLAHELGHFAHKHVIKRLISISLIIFIAFWMLDVLLKSPWFYAAFNVQPSNIIALLLFSLVIPPFSSFIMPLMAQFSRRHEFSSGRLRC